MVEAQDGTREECIVVLGGQVLAVDDGLGSVRTRGGN